MKKLFTFFTLAALIALTFSSCEKEQYFKSEKTIKKKLAGTWDLVAIPRYYVVSATDTIYHIESWFFDDTNIKINQNGIIGSSTYSVKTNWTKAEFKIDGISSPLSPEYYNGTWQIVAIDDEFLKIANDDDGTTGITELEFSKRK